MGDLLKGCHDITGLFHLVFIDFPCNHGIGCESGADLVIKGPGEAALKEIIQKYTGFLLDDGCCTGHLDDLPLPAFDLQHKISYMPILTSRGCPFSCEYCASSYLEPKMRRRSADNVFKEIVYWYENFGVNNFAFYDDALLVDAKKHAFVLFEKIIAAKMDLFFHTPNALHIKAITKQAAQLMFAAGFKTIRLGLETTDFSNKRQHDIKVRQDQFHAAIDHLKNAGFQKEQLGAYLLCGLPGQNLDDVEFSMNLVKQKGVTPVLAYYTPIPHTPMWENAVKNAKYDLLQHPVFTNNTLFPCVHSNADLQRISQLKNS